MNWLHFSLGAILTMLLLALGHWFPWPRKLPRLRAYVYGVASIGVGCTIWGGLDENWWTVLGWWILAFLGGATVYLAYWIDDRVLDYRKARKGDKHYGTEKRRLADRE